MSTWCIYKCDWFICQTLFSQIWCRLIISVFESLFHVVINLVIAESLVCPAHLYIVIKFMSRGHRNSSKTCRNLLVCLPLVCTRSLRHYWLSSYDWCVCSFGKITVSVIPMVCRSGKVSKERITSIEPVLDILPCVVSQMNCFWHNNLFVFRIVFFKV